MWPAASPTRAAHNPDENIIQSAGIKGGLVVHLDCGDGRLTAALRANDAYLVHGLATDADEVAEAREYIRSQGLYGSVSVDQFDGRRLPYVDNLVNLLVTDDLDEVTMNEVMRVLAPLGVAYVDGEKIVKPWPKEIDEWTHFLHGADNNAVAKDTVVGPPERFQWIAGPRWARSHDHLSSLSAMVSTQGRIFYIVDEAPAASVAFEPEWRLVARDAFSGVLLWKRKVEPWEGHLRPFRTGPTALARRLVAVGDRVYVTLGYGKPISILDAATGKIVLACEGTDNAMEIAVDSGTVFAVVGDRAPLEMEDTGRMSVDERKAFIETWRPEAHWRVWREKAPLKHLVANDAETGRLLWKKDDADTREIMPTAMAVSDRRVFIQNEKAIVALDAGTGKQIWRSERPINLHSPGSSSPTLVAVNGVVICADREVRNVEHKQDGQDRSVDWYVYPHTDHSRKGEAIAYDAATGKRLWSVDSVENFKAPTDIFVLNDKTYVRGYTPGLGVGIDLRTGKVKEPLTTKSPIRDPGTHWRCYRNKATEKYLILCQRWSEFYDLETRIQTSVNFVRGSCQYGQMPCNGLLYAPHDSCACSIESKLNSIKALAPVANPTEDIPWAARLEKGAAYGQIGNRQLKTEDPNDWPTYRCDSARSGAAKTTVNANLAPVWETKLNGRLTAPVVADDMLITAAPDDHAVHALSADSGERMWSFTAGGTVDSPPTIYQGMVIFGCADGSIYCLRASDGAMMWRYRAAPIDRRIVAYGNVESVWPLHGSVLIQDGNVYAAAGRSTHMDGLFFCALDASTGQVLLEKKTTQAAFPDVLSSNGTDIFMRQLRLNKQGVAQPPNVPHLFSAAGFLDDTWWHRTYWQFGTGMPGGYARWFSAGELRPAGRLMVMERERIYGFGRLNQYDHVGSHVGLGKMQNLLYAANQSDFSAHAAKANRERLPWSARKPDIPTLWKGKIDLLARGMVLCGKVLFVAGPPDLFGVAPGDAPHPYAPASAESLQAQREALEGKGGSLLWAVSSDDGRKLSEHKLDGLPAWDGLIAARGRLYMTMQDGTVMCMKERNDGERDGNE
jgi:outer membrane protein assembly factor BamB